MPSTSNYRVFYACQAIAIGPEGSTSPTLVHGMQSVGLNTGFNLEQVFELGQLALYENIENLPDVEITGEKVLDGYPHMYLLATQGAADADLAGRSDKRCQIYLSIFRDTQKFASGTPVDAGALLCSGMYPSQISYNLPVQGNYTESFTAIGNHKLWFASASSTPLKGASLFGPTEDAPQAAGPSGGVNRRENMVFKVPSGVGLVYDVNSTINDQRLTVLPTQIPGITASGTNIKTGDQFGAHIGDISISTSLTRDAIFEQGRRTPYYRPAGFPTEVTCSINVTASAGDYISAIEEGGVNGAGEGSNLKQESIRIRTMEGSFFDLGVKNKLAGVTYGGGDAGGGNVNIVYNFSNFNDLTVRHTHDPTAALRCLPLETGQFTN